MDPADPSLPPPNPPAQPPLLDRFRLVLADLPLSPQARDQLIDWVRQFIFFHRPCLPGQPPGPFRHPGDMAEPEVAAFLAHLAGQAAPFADQAQAQQALCTFYDRVLHRPLPLPLAPPPLPPAPPPRLLDEVRNVLRVRHYSYRTEACYVRWIRQFILFHGKRHPREIGAPEIEQFLTHLAVKGQVAASTQN